MRYNSIYAAALCRKANHKGENQFMRSIKTKLFSLAMAVSMVLALAGCAMSAPSTVGSIGGVEIPAGIYLLAQYNSYNTASGVAELATGETASDVKAVLKATCTGTINGEDVTAVGSDYVAQLTTHAIEYYAAVEKQFAERTACGAPTVTCTPPTVSASPAWRPTCSTPRRPKSC